MATAGYLENLVASARGLQEEKKQTEAELEPLQRQMVEKQSKLDRIDAAYRSIRAMLAADFGFPEDKPLPTNAAASGTATPLPAASQAAAAGTNAPPAQTRQRRAKTARKRTKMPKGPRGAIELREAIGRAFLQNVGREMHAQELLDRATSMGAVTNAAEPLDSVDAQCYAVMNRFGWKLEKVRSKTWVLHELPAPPARNPYGHALQAAIL